MARNNNGGRGIPSGTPSWGAQLSGASKRLAEQPIGTLTTRRMETLTVIVSVDQVDLRDFTSRVHGEVTARVRLAGGEMPVSIDEMFRYFVTAMHTRVTWVIRGRFIVRPDDSWALPVPMAQVVSALGIVETGPGVRYVPAWHEGADQYLLTYEEWSDITRRLLSLESLPGVEFIHAIEKAQEGVERVMCLLQGTEDGVDYFYSDVPIHALEALISLIAGLSPERRVDVGTLPPQLIPIHFVSRTWVVGFMHEYATLGNAG